jgi:hypothetical protein
MTTTPLTEKGPPGWQQGVTEQPSLLSASPYHDASRHALYPARKEVS